MNKIFLWETRVFSPYQRHVYCPDLLLVRRRELGVGRLLYNVLGAVLKRGKEEEKIINFT